MKTKSIFYLTNQKEIKDYIGDVDYVYYKHGCWNNFNLVPTSYALEEVAKSGYGAGLSQSVENDSEFYITVPSHSDMY